MADLPAPADPIVARYVAGLRPARRRYLLLIAAVSVLLVAGVVAAWLTGEVRATTISTASGPEPEVAAKPLGATLAVAWVSEDATAGGSTKTQGTIVTYGDHAVRGRSAITGEVRWSYTRTDVTVCDVVTQDGLAVALFRKNGNCDQAVGLDAVTGERRWNRTLFDTGDSVMTSRTGSALIVTDSSVHILSPGFDPANVPSGGLDRWYWEPKDCTVDAAQLGGRGMLASLTCNGTERLVLRKPYEDGEVWSVADVADPVVVTDGAAVGWDAAAGNLISFDLETGARAATAALPGCTDPVGSELAGMAMVLCGGTLHAFTAASGTLSQVWAIAASALPVLQSTPEAESSQVVVLRPASGGTAAATVAVPTGTPLGGSAPVLPSQAQRAAEAASRIERNGAGLLIAGTSTMMLSGAP